jgi:hypothetical protein
MNFESGDVEVLDVKSRACGKPYFSAFSLKAVKSFAPFTFSTKDGICASTNARISFVLRSPL